MNSWLLWSLMLIGGAASLAPCPMATNIAAVGYLCRTLGPCRKTLPATILYIAGRITAYVAIGLLVSGGLAAAPGLSYWLQEELPLYLGPAMMLAGLVVLGYIPFFSFGKAPGSDNAGKIVNRFGLAGAFTLGFVFALALCPPSAALFFGTAIPLSLEGGSGAAWLGIAAFGFGTALPVAAFSILFAFSMEKTALVMRNLRKVQHFVKNLTGWFFIVLGAYWIFTKIFFV